MSKGGILYVVATTAPVVCFAGAPRLAESSLAVCRGEGAGGRERRSQLRLRQHRRVVPGGALLYQVDGKSYTGKRLSFGVGGGSFVLWALRGLVPGGPVRVFYDPAKPFHSVLRPGPAPTAVILIVAGALIALAAIVHGPLQPNPG